MKSKDIFEFEDTIDNSTNELDFSDMNMDLDDYDDLMYNPLHVDIPDDTYVDLIKDTQIIKSGEWKEINKWITDNFDDLSGTFEIAKGGSILFKFTLSS